MAFSGQFSRTKFYCKWQFSLVFANNRNPEFFYETCYDYEYVIDVGESL